jgi:hypothetical protein
MHREPIIQLPSPAGAFIAAEIVGDLFPGAQQALVIRIRWHRSLAQRFFKKGYLFLSKTP